MQIRKAALNDIKRVQLIEKDYYEGFSCDENILKLWIKTNNFFVAEENNKILGFMFFEFLDEVKDLPFIHEPVNEKGKYVYVSEIAVINNNIKLMQDLFDFMLKLLKRRVVAVIWVT